MNSLSDGGTRTMKREIIGISPFGYPDPRLIMSLSHAGALGILDLGDSVDRALEAIDSLQLENEGDFGVLISDKTTSLPLPNKATVVVLSSPRDTSKYREKNRTILTQVCSLQEARDAVSFGVDGLIVKGSEAGGRVGRETTFILLQKIIPEAKVPVWAQGGIGVHTAAMAITAGAEGVVFDSQLALFPESEIPEKIKRVIELMDGSETSIVEGHRVYARRVIDREKPDFEFRYLKESQGLSEIDGGLLPVGQDGAFSKSLVERFRSVAALVKGISQSIHARIRQAEALAPFAPESSLSRRYRIRYPIVQGPMSSVSDSASFAQAISDGGGLPFIALSMMPHDKARKLLNETKERMGDRPWGVGLIGFASSKQFREHVALFDEIRPNCVIIAGGKPSQAQGLEKQGIEAYLHVPSPGLLEIFIKEGIRKFVLEGLECGGHVGPRTSFVLWESAIEILLKSEVVRELHVLFAGGIHDALSAAMVSVLATSLAVRGAKVGVLMGTAYLFTEEAVTFGAIGTCFQKTALSCEETVILETAPGHATRAAKSKYVDYYRAERQRLEIEGRDPRAIWTELERLNLGRLRLASKAERFSDNDFIPVNATTQQNEGLFMMGQVATLNDRLMTIAELHEKVSIGSTERISQARRPRRISNQPNQFDIAIIGMACVLPEAEDMDVFWRNILEAKDCVIEVPDERWNKQFFYDPMGKGETTPSKWGGFIPRLIFEPAEYGIPPRSISSIDPAHLLSLHVVNRALKDARIDMSRIDRQRISVVFGTDSGSELERLYSFRSLYGQLFGHLPDELDRHLPKLTEDSFPGVLANVTAGRVANRFDFGGINYSVTAACASGLAAVDCACRVLLTGAADLAIAGGADLHNSISDYLMFASVHALSPTGKCRPFDAKADGTVLGEGVVALILKRLEDARRDGDRVYAVIKSVGASSDGKCQGLTAPNPYGQIRALQEAYDRAGISPYEANLIEAHGTGTVVGDRSELSALTDLMYETGAAKADCTLGSVKSLIGHTKCAAGLAGMVKAALSIYHGVLPPSGIIDSPNPYYDSNNSPFVFQTTPKPWLSDRRNAGVSAFGFGGANFHAVLESTENGFSQASARRSWPYELFLFRGRNRKEAIGGIQNLLSSGNLHHFTLNELAAIVSTRGSTKDRIQIALVVESFDDLKQKLTLLSNNDSSKKGVYLATEEDFRGKVAFLFPGQGSQYLNMLSDVFVFFPRLRFWLARGSRFTRYLFPKPTFDNRERSFQARQLDDTKVAQPVLGIANSAMADLLNSLKIKPIMVGGHSYGELTALAYAGVIDRDQLIEISVARAESILEVLGNDPGTMAAVRASADEVEKYLVRFPNVVVANHNAPRQTVISGATEEVIRLSEKLKSAGYSVQSIPLSCGFHSPMVSGAAALLARKIKKATIAQPRVDVYSNASAQLYPLESNAIRERICQHVVSTVRFHDQIHAMYAAGARVFVEVGPSSVLSGLVGSILQGKPHKAIATDQRASHGLESLLIALAQLATSNVSIDFSSVFDRDGTQTVDLEDSNQFMPSDSAWTVNGQYAHPRNKDSRIRSYKPNLKPITTSSDVLSSVSSSQREIAVLKYFQNMREIVEGQRQAIMSFLGENAGSIHLSEDDLSSQYDSNSPVDGFQERETDIRSVYPDSDTPLVTTSVKKPKDVLLTIFSEKTGYPIEILDTDLDIEADLGIDSIKRAEFIGAVKSSFDLNIDMNDTRVVEELATLKTLKHIVSWLEDHLRKNENDTRTASDHRLPDSIINAIQALVEIISQRTGYPESVLEIDLDIEADLGIDSIKRAEILESLSQRFGLQLREATDNRDDTIEELSSLRTIRAIGDWIEERYVKENNSLPSFEESAPRRMNNTDDHRIINKSCQLRRYVLDVSPSPSSENEDASIAGRRLAIIGNNGVSQSLFYLLKSKGAVPVILKEVSDSNGIDGLIYLDELKQSIEEPANTLYPLSQQIVRQKPSWIVAAGTSCLYRSRKSDLLPSVSLSGFLKSIANELGTACVRTVELNPDDKNDDLAQYLYKELLIDDKVADVSYTSGIRRVITPKEKSLAIEDPLLKIGPEKVVLITGGGRGITAQISIGLARRFGCKLELIGSSPTPSEHESSITVSCRDSRAIREALIRSNESERVAFSEIEKGCRETLKAREIRTTLHTIRETGSEVCYNSVNVLDTNALSNTVERILKKHGRIDGVIHGAGVTEDKLLNSKTLDSFNSVFNTKAKSAEVLVHSLLDKIEFIAFLSSIVSVFGNRGQADYAAANEYLDRLALRLSKKDKKRALAVNFGPWSKVGMVSAELERYYREKRVGLIHPDDGVNAFINELIYGSEPQVILTADFSERNPIHVK